MAYYLSILLSLKVSLLHKLNIVSFSCFQANDQNILEYLHNLEYFSCKMGVRIHGFFTWQLNFSCQEISVFSLIFSFLPPSILIKQFKNLLQASKYQYLFGLYTHLIPKKEMSCNTIGIMSPPFVESLKIIIRSSLEVALSPPPASWPLASVSGAPWLSVWVALWSQQAGEIMCSRASAKYLSIRSSVT